MRIPLTEMVPWATASFPSEEARDRFLGVVATLPIGGVEGAPTEDLGTGALVRWRPGHFLGVNDIAYAHGGRIILDEKVTKRTSPTFTGLAVTKRHGLWRTRSR